MIDLVAYDAGDRVIHGTIEMTGGRLTDTLAAGGIIVARAVVVSDLARGRLERHDELLVDTRRLRLARITGPRGSLLRRIAVMPFPAVVHVDGYVVHGLLHAPPARNPIREAAARPWLPMTEAVLEHHPAGIPVRERYDGLLVNRSHAHAIVRTDPGALHARWTLAADPVSLPDPARHGRRSASAGDQPPCRSRAVKR